MNYVRRFFYSELSGAIFLSLFTLFAIFWVNSSLGDTYEGFWQSSFLGMSLHHFINDGLMTLFFLMVGIEIKKEIIFGELSSPQKALLPVVAALGGMIVPALIYFFFNPHSPESNGWGIPMATDIAFAVGALHLLGERIPKALIVFLLAFAIVDDIGAILVIALFYSSSISWIHLLIGLGIFCFLTFFKTQKVFIYLIGGFLGWYCFLKSGVHPTLAGILLAFAIPSDMGHHLKNKLHFMVSFGILPLFALANAGVKFYFDPLLHPVSLGVMGGLIFGKQIGITLASYIAVKLKFADLPGDTQWKHLYGVACLGGIGFTVSIFIGNLAFTNDTKDIVKVGVLVSSLISALWGIIILKIFSKRSQGN